MKKITFAFILFSSFSLFAQNQEPNTSVEEYNYMTKGYQLGLSSGLDIKKGYSVDDITVYNIDTYQFAFKNLVRDFNKSTAGIIVVATSKTWGNKYYLAIPFGDLELLKDYNSKVSLWDEPMTTAYAQATSMLMSTLFKYYDTSTKALKK